MLDVCGRVFLLRAGERSTEPVREPVAFRRGLAELALHEHDEGRRGVTDEARRDLGVVEVPGHGADGVGEHVEVLLGGVQHGKRVGLEQLPEQSWINRERVDEGDVGIAVRIVPCELDERELREVRAFAMELGVDRVPGQADKLVDEG
jgi:hypothetical protein